MELIRIPEQKYEPTADLVKDTQYVIHNNPFDPLDKTVIHVAPGKSCYSMLSEFNYDMDLYDVVIARNNEIVDVDFYPEVDDIIQFSLVPRGGNGNGRKILMTVLMIVLIVVSYGAASAYGAGMNAALGLAEGSAIGGALVSAAVMTIGGMLINSLFKPSIPSLGSSSGTSAFESSPTYGWDSKRNQLQQGNPVPIIYGTVVVYPQYIAKYLRSVDDDQYLYALLAIGEGKLDSINELAINDEPIAHFTDVSISSTLGTNSGAVLPNFGDTYNDISIGKPISRDVGVYAYGMTTGDSVTSVTVGITCPGGLYYANNDGGLDAYSIAVSIEYRLVGNNTWYNLRTQNAEGTKYRYYYMPIKNSAFFPTKSVRYSKVNDATGYISAWEYWRETIYPNGTRGVVEKVGSGNLPDDVNTSESARIVFKWPVDGQNYFTFYKDRAGELIDATWISGATTSPIRRSYTVNNLTPGMYEVRVRYAQFPSTSSRYMTAAIFEYLQEGIPDDFYYPNTALLGLSIKATDQLNGQLPRIAAKVSKLTGPYGSLDNPAWACLDILTNTRYGAGVDIADIDMPSFTTWANYCTAQNYKVNIIIDQFMSIAQILNMIGQLGRGAIVQQGSTYKVVADMANILPTQGFLFSMGNILENSFSQTFLPLKDRANVIQVTYFDETNDYERTQIQVAQGNYDLVNNVNTADLMLYGCTNREQAVKQAYYHLKQNRYTTITATWEASIDSIYCVVGDIVNVAHDVPKWGYSGRIENAESSKVLINEEQVFKGAEPVYITSSYILIDRDDLSMDVGKTYYIQISNGNTDEQLYYKVLSIVGNRLGVEGSLPDVMDYSVYSFGEMGKHAMQMRILSITTTSDLLRKITAIEYNPNVTNDALIEIDPVEVSDFGMGPLEITESLEAKRDGTIITNVHLKWSGEYLYYNISIRDNKDPKYKKDISRYTGTSISFNDLVDGHEYVIRVGGEEVIYTVLGKTAPPPPVTNLTGSELNNTYTLSWDYEYKPLDFKEFLIYEDTTVIGNTTANNYSYVVPAMDKEIRNFKVVAMDTTGHESEPLYITITATPVEPVTGLSGSIVKDILKLEWSTPAILNFKHCNIYNGDTYLGNSTEGSYTGVAPKHPIGLAEYRVQVVNTSGNKSEAITLMVPVTDVGLGNFTYSFSQNTCTLQWEETSGSYLVERYLVDTGLGQFTIAAPTLSFPLIGKGDKTIAITSIDSAGNSTTNETIVEIVPPSIPIITAHAIGTTGIEFLWSHDIVGTTGIKNYTIVYNGNTLTTANNNFILPTTKQGQYIIAVYATDFAGNDSKTATYVYSIGMPSIGTVTQGVVGNRVTLDWTVTEGSFKIASYKIEYDTGLIDLAVNVTSKHFELVGDWVGEKVFTITPIDIAGNEGVPVQHSVDITVPNTPTITYEIIGKDLSVYISQSPTVFAIDSIEIAYDDKIINAAAGAANWTVPVFWDQTKVFYFTSIDIQGNRSETAEIDILIQECEAINAVANVIDNNVLLQWGFKDGTLPVDHFKIMKGPSLEESKEIGIIRGTFSTVFENESGQYIYWIVPVDTAGNDGIATSAPAKVHQPPDFVLNANWVTNWSAASTTNVVVVDQSKAVMPINKTHTISQHFSTYTWSTAQDQVNAGYPLWLTPSTLTATATQVFDYGTSLSTTMVTVTDPVVVPKNGTSYTQDKVIFYAPEAENTTVDTIVNANANQVTVVDGTGFSLNNEVYVTQGGHTYTGIITYKSGNTLTISNLPIEIAEFAYVAKPGAWQQATIGVEQFYVTNIRFIKVVYTWTTTAETLLEVGNFVVRLDSKVHTDSGAGHAHLPINITSMSGTGMIATASFSGQPSIPYKAGQFIEISGVTPAAWNGTYEVVSCSASSVVFFTTNSSTVTAQGKIDNSGTTVTFNTPFVDVISISVTPSGTVPMVAIYDFEDAPDPTHFKVYLYDMNGTRVNGNFSWTVRGY